jgi:DNA-binding GntR family transcriptional regulator
MHGVAEFTSLRLTSKRRSESVYRAVKQAILLRDHQPGDALLEQDLANGMNCSQGTVREALMRLEQDGLVARRGYRGTVVSATSADEAALLATVRIEIEVKAAARVAALAAKGELAALDGIVAAMREREAAGDTFAMSELDNEFHGLVLRVAGLGGMLPILTRCMLHLHRHTVGNPDRRARPGMANAAAAHANLARALRGGNAEQATAAAREHIESVIRRWSPDVWAALKAA